MKHNSLLLVGCFLGLLFYTEDGVSTFLRNISEILYGYAVTTHEVSS
jgi:hypothetical protein